MYSMISLISSCSKFFSKSWYSVIEWTLKFNTLFEVVVLSHATVCYKLEPEINYWTDMFQLYIIVFNSAKMKSANIIIVAHVLLLVSNHIMNTCLSTIFVLVELACIHYSILLRPPTKWQGVTSHQCKLPCDFPNWGLIMHQRDLQKRRASMTGTSSWMKKMSPMEQECTQMYWAVSSGEILCMFFFLITNFLSFTIYFFYVFFFFVPWLAFFCCCCSCLKSLILFILYWIFFCHGLLPSFLCNMQNAAQ